MNQFFTNTPRVALIHHMLCFINYFNICEIKKMCRFFKFHFEKLFQFILKYVIIIFLYLNYNFVLHVMYITPHLHVIIFFEILKV